MLMELALAATRGDGQVARHVAPHREQRRGGRAALGRADPGRRPTGASR